MSHTPRCWSTPSPYATTNPVPGPNEQTRVDPGAFAFAYGSVRRSQRLWVSAIPAPGTFYELVAEFGIGPIPGSAVQSSRVYGGGTDGATKAFIFATDVDRLIINNGGQFPLFVWKESVGIWMPDKY